MVDSRACHAHGGRAPASECICIPSLNGLDLGWFSSLLGEQPPSLVLSPGPREGLGSV